MNAMVRYFCTVGLVIGGIVGAGGALHAEENFVSPEVPVERGADVEDAALLPAPGMLTLGFFGGESEFEGRVDTLLPLWRGSCGAGVLLGNLRAAFGDGGEQELNAGLVLRRYVARWDVVLGGNVFYDARWTRSDNHFNQMGAGLELLSKWVDLRANLYLPENDRAHLGRETHQTLVSEQTRTHYREYAVRHQVREQARVTQTRTYRTDVVDVYEVPLRGFDAEVGVRFPLPESWNTVEARLFLGYYDFEPRWTGNLDSGRDIAGVKGRVEIRAWNHLFLDAEWFENDRLYNTDYLVGVRLRMPFGVEGIANPFRGGSVPPSGRLAEMVMRDPRIQIRNRLTLEQSLSTQTERIGRRDRLLLDDVLFVFGDNAGDPVADGSAERPFGRLQEGVDAAEEGGLQHVYVFGASQPYRETVDVRASLNLHGEGCPVHRGTPATRGFGRPVIEGPAADAFFTPAVIAAHEVELFRLAGFEVTAAPFAGGSYSMDSGPAPLVGLLATDVRELDVACNRFRNLVVGVASMNMDMDGFTVNLRDNRFDNVGLGIGTVIGNGGRVRISGNDIRNSLLSIGVLGLGMDGSRTEIEIERNRITGAQFDLAGILPYAIWSDLLGLPDNHPESLPLPTLGGMVVVAGPSSDLGVRIVGNEIVNPAFGILALTVSDGLFGGGGAFPARMDLEIRGNRLQGGGLETVYSLARAHAGTIFSLLAGDLDLLTPEEIEARGDELRDILPPVLGVDGGVAGILTVALGEGAEMNGCVIAENQINNYILGITMVGALGADVNAFDIRDNRLDGHIAGISLLGALDADMNQGQIRGNQLSNLLFGISVLGLPGARMQDLRIVDNHMTLGLDLPAWISDLLGGYTLPTSGIALLDLGGDLSGALVDGNTVE